MAKQITATLLIDLNDNLEIVSIKTISQDVVAKAPKAPKAPKAAAPELEGDLVLLETKAMLSDKLLKAIDYAPGMRIVINYTPQPGANPIPVIATAKTMGKSLTSYLVSKAGSIRISGNPYSLLKAAGTVFEIADCKDNIVTLSAKVKDPNIIPPSTKTDEVNLDNMPTFSPAVTEDSVNNNDLTEVSSDNDTADNIGELI